ncbi:PhoH family protein [Mediterraneibacter catenae]|jgi:PhoH-like ATPase|uniref:PhoH family protein n=1 Tax=Mediterraneibacter catenae TaxID=2594882 RepID=A0A5M9HYN4_9FIRM|nr:MULTISPECIES: PhoH family protein [Mediterraneibacter]KAA8501743.1 PhoH family protein [Mediterraneibacter catenae]MDN0045059.1 PhoH family protein [Mediterraneibacter glycyrrhizinilyticus]OUO27136.1 ribonuclease [Lachnoclostridium sp. An298]HJA18537.1 PhoH family protein [Candidatus Mediterraneibacter ornithocaccae]
MVKIYVVDTNILLQAPYAIESFEDNAVVLPMVVLEELDHFKKAEGEVGANARRVIRCLEQIRQKGDLLKGVPLGNGGVIRVEKNFVDVKLPGDLAEEAADNRILRVCLGLAQSCGEQVILVTKDILLRIKAQILGICAEDFTTDQVLEHENQYSGRCELYVPEEIFKDFKKKGVPADQTYVLGEDGENYVPKLSENQFVVLKADQSAKKTQLGRVSGGVIRKLEYRKSAPYGITPRNTGQYFLQEALMQPAEKAPLVIVKGMAGTSKTFYSLAVGLEKLLNHPTGEYRRILICRPNAQFDDDIGFLPGDEQEKISPLMRPVIDNLEQLIDSSEEERYRDEEELKGKVEEIFARGIIQAEALNYIRGRSIVKTYLIIDEAQNTTPDQIKGIITRAGKDTKIILLGDPNQIDRPFLDERTNGLSYASEHMKGSPLCWQITMTAGECERSALAMEAVRRL